MVINFRSKKEIYSLKVTCSFCGNSEDNAALMIKRSEEISICDECLSMCLETLTGKLAHAGYKQNTDMLHQILDRAGIQADLSQFDQYSKS